ncbi:S-adenosyl-L-methionine-dependent methyltransferase [Mycena latifolia]|nr:S-adenosyl-L-methionine-dependent methyltransferase [Mycena latifolia]
MKLFSAVFDIVGQMRMALMLGLPPVPRAIFAAPSLLFNPTALSRISVWAAFGQGGDFHARPDKEALITPHASGVVLDLGAGHGYTATYLDRAKCTKYIALEPNALMHAQIRAKADAAGFSEADGSLVLLACGAADIASILSAAASQKIDTLVSVLTLCTVPAPQQTLRELVEEVLAPGGTLLFYEHGLATRADVAWWQRFWTPLWAKVFDGCRLDRPTHLWIEELTDDNGESFWREGSVWNASGFEEENLFWRRMGRFVKK